MELNLMLRVVCLLVGLLLALGARAAEEFHWWEAEAATATNLSTDPGVAKDAALAAALSGGQWLRGKTVAGGFAEYAVTITDAGTYQFFARRFWMHGAYRWRFDEQPWTEETDRQRIVDSVPGTPGTPLCWLDLGPVTLAAGPHVLRVELLAADPYKFNSLYSFDCFVLSHAPWAPKGLDHAGGPVTPTITIREEDFGKYLPRTMALLTAATPEHRTHLNILCYGQSIIASGWVDQALKAFFAEKYPNCIVTIKNTAIGGYEAPILRRTAWQDLYPAYPDLVMFHDYGGEGGEYEEIIRNLRTYTTAELFTWTHHVDCFGTTIDQTREVASELTKKLGAQYGYEVADVRAAWKTYLREQRLKPQVLCTDQIHLNAKGGKLLGELLLPHFRVNPTAAGTAWQQQVQTLAVNPPAAGLTVDAAGWQAVEGGVVGTQAKPLRLAFTGNRVDVVALATAGKPGSATILLDGQPPSARASSYAVSRSTLAPGSWWPAITRVELGAHPVAEEITLAFSEVKPDGTAFTFTATGAVSGAEGTGTAGTDFVASSGRFRIAAADLALANVPKIMKKDLPATFAITFKIYSMGRDTWQAPAPLRADRDTQATLIQCWDSGPHVLEIIPTGNGPVGIKSLITHTPPLTPKK